MSVQISGTSGLTFPDTTTLPSAIHSNIYPLVVTASSGALTATLNPCAIDFRSATLTTGTTSTVAVTTAISVTAPSGATLGAPSGTAVNVMIVAINNAGTVSLGLIQQSNQTVTTSGGVTLDETGVISTTAISASATSANVYYSPSALANLPYRVVGYCTAVNTSGAWASPTLVQGYGGQSMVGFQSIGYGQTWQNVTGSRAITTTYYNTTGKPILASVLTGAGQAPTLTINSIVVATCSPGTGNTTTVCGIVPPGGSYAITSGTPSTWSELR
jgi:hypothetical protein